jgi:DMSO/TMAO reductase YedYZ molybdopterin-dependent catalytic subunit
MEQASGAPFGEAGHVTPEELQLAARNHGMPLEVLRHDVTPVGLHYLLIHYDIPAVDPGTWTLEAGGRVARPRRFTLDDIRARPSETIAVTMECAGNGRALLAPRPLSQPWLYEAVGTARWTGAPLGALLEDLGMEDSAVDVVFRGLDRGVEGGVEQFYERALSADEARRPDVLLAYEMNGEPLPPQHGAPLRLVVPGWYGMTSVKWLSQLTVSSEPFTGYQQRRAYTWRTESDDPGTPMSRMLPRALLAPPGIPDFFTRRRTLRAGPCPLEGRAWSGWAAITAVDVSVDGGATWHEAMVEPASLGQWAWQRWRYDWDAHPGEHLVCCRAADAAGNSQAERGPWNIGGYANPEPQHVPVTVVDAD